jgi:GNAT superfamily N-acetyltransferase
MMFVDRELSQRLERTEGYHHPERRPGRDRFIAHGYASVSRGLDIVEAMTSQPTCRPARASERQALEALQRRASLSNPNDREALLAHPDAIELPLDQIVAGHVFVVEWNGTTAGFAAVVPRDDGNSELDALFVEPDHWKHGFGRLLVEHCASVARTRGSAALHVIGNPHAEGFYRACGFEQIGTTHTRFGMGLLFRRGI